MAKKNLFVPVFFFYENFYIIFLIRYILFFTKFFFLQKYKTGIIRIHFLNFISIPLSNESPSNQLTKFNINLNLATNNIKNKEKARLY